MKTPIILLGSVFFAAAVHAALPVQTTFTGVKSEHTWALLELNAALPADWTDCEFLVLEFKASSSQRFDLGLETPQGRIARRIGPFAGVWVRAAIPLRFYRQPAGDGIDMAATFNQPRNSYWINIHSSGYGSLTNVSGITVAMDQPVSAPTLEIRSVTLAKTDPGDAVLNGQPLIDEFGQYTRAEWPGKAHSLDELKMAWSAEEAALKTVTSDRCPYGGFRDAPAKATGFFRVEQRDGRWWFVCPDGHLFYSTGLNGVSAGSGTRVPGREDLFAALPPASLVPGGRGGRSFGGSFYTWNLQRRFGDNWRPPWAELTTRRLAAWGFNTVHNWGAPSRNQAEPRVPYALMMRGWQTGRSIMGLPDVYAEDFARRVDEAAASQLEPLRDDPFMLGFFIGNEPPWPGRESQLCDAILAGQASEIQKRLQAYLSEADTPERRKGFVLEAFQHYLDTINAAVRQRDPNHLNLGIRFGGNPHDDVVKAARGFDVFSVNIYRYAPERSVLDRIYALVQRPILIGEFHIGAPERGLASGLVQAMNQPERAVAYRYYVEQTAAHPALVGTHWFQWLDQPATGRNDGENYNIGFVDVADRPYPELVQAAQATHQRLLEVHSGKTPPFDQKPKSSEADAAANWSFRHHFIDRTLPVTDNLVGDYGLTALVDLDKDGDLDFVLGGRPFQPSQLYWYEFQAPDRWVRHVAGTNYLSDVGLAVLDVDRDGWPDLVCSGVWYRNTGKPRAQAFERIIFDENATGAHDVLIADIDGDGKADLVLMGDERTKLNALCWYSIPSDPRQPWRRHPIGPPVHGAILPNGVADLDGDGDLDIIRADTWFENKDGHGREWAPHQNIPMGRKGPYGLCVRTALADLDGDGQQEIVMVDTDIVDSKAAVLKNADGKGGRWTKTDLPQSFTYGSLHSLAVADFNGDGKPDIVVNEQEELLPPGRLNPRWIIWENLGGNRFAERIVLDAKLGGHDLQVGDVDGDGDIDICSKPWGPCSWNGNGGKMHVDFLENLRSKPRPTAH